MKTEIIKSTLPLAFLLLVAMIGLAVAGGKAPPSNETETATVEQEVKPAMQTSSAALTSGEQINWQVISSGSTNDGNSTSFRLSTTVGQTAVGMGSSTNFGLSHGFWQEFGGGGTCCIPPIRGDVNYDSVGPNIQDLTFLVAYLFGGGVAPPCAEEADVNGDSNGPNIQDLTYLVAYLFGGGPAPAACP